MPGLQSFVAQRQQGQPNPSRQLLGAQHRVAVPTTKLGNTEQNPSFQRPNANLPANPFVADSKTSLSKRQSAEASAVQDGFDTDAEGFDDTATMSVDGNRRGHEVEGDDRDKGLSLYGADAANDFTLGAKVLFRRGQDQEHHVQGFRHLDAEGSGEGDDEGSYEESADEEVDEETDEEESVRDGILQDLNSPGFSQYLQGDTSPTTQAAFKPVIATPVVHSSLALRDMVQHSQKPANPFTSRVGSVNGSAADPNVSLQRANGQAHERAMKQTSAVPIQKVHDIFTEQPSISGQLAVQHRRSSDHHSSSYRPSVAYHQTLRPTLREQVGTAQDIVATNVQPQANVERPLLVQSESTNLGDDESSVDWDPNVDRRHDSRSSASVDDPQTRKRFRDLDHRPDQLSGMTFQQLSNEPFNLASDRTWASIPQELSSSTLAAKIEYILEDLKDDDAKFVQRRAFFSSLSIEQYEECANLMIRRFSDIMSKFTEARQQRRRAAKDFEEEVAKREESVRGKTTIVDRDLGRLKRGGEEVVRGAAL